MDFESDLDGNLRCLKNELEGLTYRPSSLTNFIVRDPKTRVISSSKFRDRVIHHALCNIICPILERDFIYDSFANQKRKGTHSAIRRFEMFQNKVVLNRTKNGQTLLSGFKNRCAYVLKADIKQYFDNVDHEILLRIIGRRIKDENVLWLIRVILENHKTEVQGKGMPLGNLTSQFFANVYLGELDRFVKHSLKARYYIRYVDDFVILHRDRKTLEAARQKIDEFLRSNLGIELHREKTRIIEIKSGVTFLGFRVFSKYRLLKKSNARRIWRRLDAFKRKCDSGEMTPEEALRRLQGWMAYAEFANTYKMRRRIAATANIMFGPDELP